MLTVYIRTLTDLEELWKNKLLNEKSAVALFKTKQVLNSHLNVRTCFASRGFSVAAPTIWNSLPLDIRNSCSIASFRRQLKTFFFFKLCPSLVPRLTPAPQIRRVSRQQYCALYKFIYLLTYSSELLLCLWFSVSCCVRLVLLVC